VNVDVEEPRKGAQPAEISYAGFFEHLPTCGELKIIVVSLEVATWLQPQFQGSMSDQQDSIRGGMKDEAGRSEVTGSHRAAGKGSLNLFKERQHLTARIHFSRTRGWIVFEQGVE